MADRQATLGNLQEPDNWLEVYSHGSPEEGTLIVIPEEHRREDLAPATTDGYESQVRAILKAVKYGRNHLENAFTVYNPHEAAVGCADPGGSKPSACTDLFEEIWEHTREFSHPIQFESTDLSRREIFAL